MRAMTGIASMILLLPGLGFAQGSSSALGSIRGDVFTKGTNGEPAVLPSVQIVLHGPITEETESNALGASSIDNLPAGTHQIEAKAPGLYTALTVEVSAGTLSTVPVEMSVAAVTGNSNVTASDTTKAEASATIVKHHGEQICG
jgi:Carboxypeptidase regulatory-like domain